MDNVTIFMPVSRNTYLDKIFHCLEILECDSTKTNLLVLVDGDSNLFVNVRNRVELSKFNQRLCIHWKTKNPVRQFNLSGRRRRISDIHNDSKKYISDCKFVFGLEDDTIIPSNTLKKLIKDYSIQPYAGFIQGVELGRWGIPYIGAWKADDIYNPQKIESLEISEGLQECDAGGFYCYLTTRDNYMSHDYKPFEEGDLGPDIDFGIALRQQGLINYVDWSIQCAHKNKDKDITFMNTKPMVVTMIKKDNRWRQSSN